MVKGWAQAADFLPLNPSPTTEELEDLGKGSHHTIYKMGIIKEDGESVAQPGYNLFLFYFSF